MDPNSQNQMWSEWTFTVHEIGRRVSRENVTYNVAGWLRMIFGSAGAARVRPTLDGWEIKARVEGKPAHDPALVDNVRQQFARNFVAKGWGIGAWSTVEARVLAGSLQDGKPAPQWVGIPTIRR